MRELKLKLRTQADAMEITYFASQCACRVDAISANDYVVDARSLLGLMSLDLSNPITLRFHDDTKYHANKEKFKRWRVHG